MQLTAMIQYLTILSEYLSTISKILFKGGPKLIFTFLLFRIEKNLSYQELFSE